MYADTLKFKNYRCFKDEWAGFDTIKPINLIIGRNNSGKSCLLDLLHIVLEKNNTHTNTEILMGGVFTENLLQNQFRSGTSGGQLGGSHWLNHGKLFADTVFNFITNQGKVIDFETYIPIDYTGRNTTLVETSIKARKDHLKKVISRYSHPFTQKSIKKISAERDIQNEKHSSTLELSPNGSGATNIIQQYINTVGKDRDLIQKKILDHLNTIMNPDSRFTEIQVQYHADDEQWEIFLGEAQKGLIPLSNSGSGLKTTILVLLNLYAIPIIEDKPPSNYIFIFEELENNIHPALQRRLFSHIEQYALENDCIFFITTHSNVVLDTFAKSQHAQITHITHNGNSAKTINVGDYFKKNDVIDDLGAKASDILQANGIIWLEGPSDRIYFNRWVELYSNNTLFEGRDYQCVFYGGSLLSNYTAENPDEEYDLVNILRINRNAIAICDGDRTARSGKGSKIKRRASNIRSALNELSKSHTWITDAKEIESYIPVEALRIVWNKPKLNPIAQYDPFWREPTKKDNTKGYFQKNSPTTTVDKVGLAKKVIDKMTLENLKPLFELEEQMNLICKKIQSWNSRT